MSKSLDPDQDRSSVGHDQGQKTVCKVHQQTTKFPASKQRGKRKV